MKTENLILHNWYVIDGYFKSRYYGYYKGQYHFMTECYQEILLTSLNTVSKTETLTERTKGEWKYIKDVCGQKLITNVNQTNTIIQLSGYAWRTKDNKPFYDATETTGVSDEEAEATAAFICKAVNNYDSLLSALKQYENQFQKLFTVPLGKNNEQSLKTWFVFASKDAKKAIKNAEL